MTDYKDHRFHCRFQQEAIVFSVSETPNSVSNIEIKHDFGKTVYMNGQYSLDDLANPAKYNRGGVVSAIRNRLSYEKQKADNCGERVELPEWI